MAFNVQRPASKEVDHKKKTDDVNRLIGRTIDQGGPLMKRAETSGLQSANRRGLLNSSMAVGAAQGAVVDRAYDIGATQAQINAQRNEGIRQFERQSALQQKEMGFGRQQDRKGRQHETRLAKMNVAAEERRGTQSALSDAERTYAGQYASIMGNQGMDAQARDRAVRDLERTRAARISAIEQIYDVRIDFDTTTMKRRGGGGGKSGGGKGKSAGGFSDRDSGFGPGSVY